MTIRNIAGIAAALLASTAASAADFSFVGTFGLDSSKAAYSFTVGAPGTVTLATLGYAGGTNAAGATIAQGGFDPVLSLYGSDGFVIDYSDDGEGVALDSATGVGGDALLSLALGAGTYTVILSQYDNFGPAFLGGNTFAFEGQPNFRDGFVDFYGSQRNGGFALDILGVDGASITAVPEASTWAMLVIGFGIVGAAARRRQAVVAA